MKATIKVLLMFSLIGLFFILSPFAWLRYEQYQEIQGVSQVLQSSSEWKALLVRRSVSWKIVVEGTVESDKALSDLRDALHRINAKKTAILVKVDSGNAIK